jgi:hypothetical protein
LSSRPGYEEAIATFEPFGPSIWLAVASQWLERSICEHADDMQTDARLTQAQARLGDALAFARALGHAFLIAETLRFIGQIAYLQHDVARAAEAWKENLAIIWQERLITRTAIPILAKGTSAVRDANQRRRQGRRGRRPHPRRFQRTGDDLPADKRTVACRPSARS